MLVHSKPLNPQSGHATPSTVFSLRYSLLSCRSFTSCCARGGPAHRRSLFIQRLGAVLGRRRSIQTRGPGGPRSRRRGGGPPPGDPQVTAAGPRPSPPSSPLNNIPRIQGSGLGGTSSGWGGVGGMQLTRQAHTVFPIPVSGSSASESESGIVCWGGDGRHLRGSLGPQQQPVEPSHVPTAALGDPRGQRAAGAPTGSGIPSPVRMKSLV